MNKQNESPVSPELSATHRRNMRLGYLIHDASRLRRKAFDQLMKPLGVTRAQWWILAHLSRRDGMTQTELAKILDVGKASLGALVDRLEAGNLIKRVSDTNDRRVKRLYLTTNSKKLLKTMNEAESMFNEQVLLGISKTDMDTLLKLMSQITGKLSAMGLESEA